MPKKKRLLLWASPLVTLLALGLLGRGQLGRIQDDAEQLAATGSGIIAVFKEFGSALAALDIDRTLACYHSKYASPNEGLWTEVLESDRDGVVVYRWESRDRRPFGRAQLERQLRRQIEGIGAIDSAKLKLDKIEQLQPTGTTVVRAVLWLRGDRERGEVFETQARLRMWLRREGEEWKISRQELLDGTTVVGDAMGFHDVAASVGLDFEGRQNPRFKTPEWYPHKFGILKYGSAGVAAADYNGDGWYDLYFADGASSRLYRNTGDGTFEDVTEETGLPVDEPSINVGLFSDFDNDGDQDLFLGRFTDGNYLFRNDGDGTFTDVTEDAGLGRNFVVVAAAGDYDLDGDLDLYLGRYLDPRTDLPTTLFYTRNSQGNSLLRNNGGLNFSDVTEESGVEEGGLTLGVAWGDYDGDGYPDLYVANDFGRNALLRNQGDGTFSDVSEEAGALDFGFGMSASFGDVDNDGDLDLYVSNVHSSQRWYGQATTLHQYLINSIRQGTIFADASIYREIFAYAGSDWQNYGDRMVKGNSLLINDGSGHFEDVSEIAGTNPFGWYWASTFFDYDNDGRQDIYAANGWITAKSQDDL